MFLKVNILNALSKYPFYKWEEGIIKYEDVSCMENAPFSLVNKHIAIAFNTTVVTLKNGVTLRIGGQMSDWLETVLKMEEQGRK